MSTFNLAEVKLSLLESGLSVMGLLKGSLSNHDGGGNENIKKAIGLITKTTTLHVHYTFWYFSLPSLHD